MTQPYNTLPTTDDLSNRIQQRVKTAVDSLRRDLQQALQNKADRAESVRTVTASTSITLDDRNVLCDTTAAAVVVTLPDARSCSGYRFTIKQLASTAHTMTIAPVSGQKLDGNASVVLNTAYTVLDALSDGHNWFAVL